MDPAQSWVAVDIQSQSLKKIMHRLASLVLAHAERLKGTGLLRQAAYHGDWFPVHDAGTGLEIARVPDMQPNQVRVAIETAHDAFQQWKRTTSLERHNHLVQWYRLIRQHEHDLATLLTLENGKTLTESLGEIRYGASFIEWFAQEARRNYGDTMDAPLSHQRFLTIRQPVGVASIITPWNFPNAMITRKVGAALAAGCTVVIKPASETPLSALALGELALQAGLPAGVVNVVTTHRHLSGVSDELIMHPCVAKVSFTGSTPVGKLIMSKAASGLKRLSLELGGNAPFIVFGTSLVWT
jgi:succinate-semialdehyde dehydrogenase/glutarate-semialdehyde dehydrogenase